jgi:hypothetical protein
MLARAVPVLIGAAVVEAVYSIDVAGCKAIRRPDGKHGAALRYDGHSLSRLARLRVQFVPALHAVFREVEVEHATEEFLLGDAVMNRLIADLLVDGRRQIQRLAPHAAPIKAPPCGYASLIVLIGSSSGPVSLRLRLCGFSAMCCLELFPTTSTSREPRRLQAPEWKPAPLRRLRGGMKGTPPARQSIACHLICSH